MRNTFPFLAAVILALAFAGSAAAQNPEHKIEAGVQFLAAQSVRDVWRSFH
jgi:hypothetical protein